MTIPCYLPISTSPEETTKTEGLPSPAAGLDQNDEKVTLHVVVSFAIFCTFSISAGHILDWEDKARRHDVVITAIVFLYLAVVFNLLLIKRHNEKRRKLEACEVIIRGTKLTWSLIWVATGIMLVSLAVAVFYIRPDWLDLVIVALCILAFGVLTFFLLIFAACEQKKYLRAKCEETSDLA